MADTLYGTMVDEKTADSISKTIVASVPLLSPPLLKNNNVGQAQALVHWLESYWLPTQQRKLHPSNMHLRIILRMQEEQDAVTTPALQVVGTIQQQQVSAQKNDNHNDGKAATTLLDDATTYWEKQVSITLKKVTIEDLGNLNALTLWETIPDQDGQGRGRHDLTKMQKDLQVHVEFSAMDSHVYLVGPKTKLAKKCITLRNVLAHYHWRLSGKAMPR